MICLSSKSRVHWTVRLRFELQGAVPPSRVARAAADRHQQRPAERKSDGGELSSFLILHSTEPVHSSIAVPLSTGAAFVTPEGSHRSGAGEEVTRTLGPPANGPLPEGLDKPKAACWLACEQAATAEHPPSTVVPWQSPPSMSQGACLPSMSL